MQNIDSNKMKNAEILDYYNELDEYYSNLDECILEIMDGNEDFELVF